MPTSAVSALIHFHSGGQHQINQQNAQREQRQQNDGQRQQIVDPAEILRHVAEHLFLPLRLFEQPTCAAAASAGASARPVGRAFTALHAGIVLSAHG